MWSHRTPSYEDDLSTSPLANQSRLVLGTFPNHPRHLQYRLLSPLFSAISTICAVNLSDLILFVVVDLVVPAVEVSAVIPYSNLSRLFCHIFKSLSHLKYCMVGGNVLASLTKESAHDEQISIGSSHSVWGPCRTHLIAVSQWEIFSSDILIRVLDSLLQRRQMLPVVPMLDPQVVGVDAAEDDAWDHHADQVSFHPFLFQGFGLQAKQRYVLD